MSIEDLDDYIYPLKNDTDVIAARTLEGRINELKKQQQVLLDAAALRIDISPGKGVYRSRVCRIRQVHVNIFGKVNLVVQRLKADGTDYPCHSEHTCASQFLMEDCTVCGGMAYGLNKERQFVCKDC